VSDGSELDAGVFSVWLEEMQGALRGDHGSDVPCGECTACCTSSQFIHIAPDETDALAHIPVALLFPAPRMPRGHVLMGYDEHGRCPMLIDNRCSIYEHRPRTCRTYDCRIFAATGLEPADDKPLIAVQVRRWRFRHPTEVDRVQHDAVRAAAAASDDRGDPSVDPPAPASATGRAVRAIEKFEEFIGRAVDEQAH
jgi:Fe-S-cluster containining protein